MAAGGQASDLRRAQRAIDQLREDVRLKTKQIKTLEADLATLRRTLDGLTLTTADGATTVTIRI